MRPDFSTVKVIFFDLDDTLCGYWDASKAGLRATFELHRFEHATPDEMINHWAVEFRKFCPSLKQTEWYEKYLVDSESTRTELMRLALARAGVFDRELAAAISESYKNERDGRLALFPDAAELLDTLQGKYPLGLITNGPADLQRMEIQTLGIGHYFEHILIEGELGFGKPVPEVFHRAEAWAGHGGESVLFVGNSYSHDIRPAIAAGWRTAWIRRPSDVPPSAHGQTDKPEELPVGAPEPDLTTGNLLEILPLIAIR